MIETTDNGLWDDIFGQTDQIAMLRRCVGRRRLPHALLFLGPSGVGKRTIARRLTQALFCPNVPDAELDACGVCPACRSMRAMTHPDYFEITRPAGSAIIPIATIAGDEDKRGRDGLMHDLSLRPMAAERRIAVIDDADRMQAEAANALLKTLEEPPARSVIILLAESETALLPTIRSRCQLLRFSPLPDDVLTRLLKQIDDTSEGGPPPITPESVVVLAGGSLDHALTLRTGGLAELRQRVITALGQPDWEPGKLAEEVQTALDECASETSAKREHSLWLLGFLADEYRRALRGEQTIVTRPDPSRTIDEPERVLTRMVDRIDTATEQIGRNSPLPLIWESLLQDLARLRDRGW